MTVVKVLEGPSAKYIPSTGLMLVSSTVEAFLNQTLADDSDGGFDGRVTFMHELIHHVQALSSNYLWYDSLVRWAASDVVMFPPSDDARMGGAVHLTRAMRAFHHRAFGISVADLCEGAAVLESFKAISAKNTPGEYLAYRDHHFPGKGNSVYHRAFDILADAIGNEAAYDLLPVLSWLALRTDIPGRAFVTLASVAKARAAFLVDRPVREIASELGLDPKLERPEDMSGARRHPTLYPVLVDLFANMTEDILVEAFGRPHKALDVAFFPPLMFGAHRLGAIRNGAFGPGKASKELRERIALGTGVVHAAMAALGKKPRHQPCPHTSCPNHSSQICGGWFTPPVAPDACGFRAFAKQRSGGKELGEIAIECERLADREPIERLATTTDLEQLFPGHEQHSMNPEATTLAERFDEKYELDAEDNDALSLIICKECRTAHQLWTSHRKMATRYTVTCSNCGNDIVVDPSETRTIHMGGDD